MKCALMLILSFSIIMVAVAESCTPGTTWKEDCNTCFCTQDGHKGCTLIACPPAAAVNNDDDDVAPRSFAY